MNARTVREREQRSGFRGSAEALTVGLQVLLGDLREEHRRHGERGARRDRVQRLGLLVVDPGRGVVVQARRPRAWPAPRPG